MLNNVEYRDEGLTPKIPKDCPQILQEIMEMCWKRDPNQRPVSFSFTRFISTISFQSDSLLCCP
jgi:hypothetical protein